MDPLIVVVFFSSLTRVLIYSFVIITITDTNIVILQSSYT